MLIFQRHAISCIDMSSDCMSMEINGNLWKSMTFSTNWLCVSECSQLEHSIQIFSQSKALNVCDGLITFRLFKHNYLKDQPLYITLDHESLILEDLPHINHETVGRMVYI